MTDLTRHGHSTVPLSGRRIGVLSRRIPGRSGGLATIATSECESNVPARRGVIEQLDERGR